MALSADRRRSTSTPTGEDVAADLEPFYHAGARLDRAAATACSARPRRRRSTGATRPRDSIELALVRQPATSGNPLGSLLVNPGGPGGSGYDFIRDSVDYATSERAAGELRHRRLRSPRRRPLDRGLLLRRPGRASTPTSSTCCPGEYGSDEWIAELRGGERRSSASDCAEHTGPLLGYVDTESAARDLDLLRAVLGDKKLNYLGYSYGTLLGATYADLFPEKTGRLVLDGALDPASTIVRRHARPRRRASRARCGPSSPTASAIDDCPFTGTVDEAMTSIRALLDRLDASPLRNDDGRELGSSTMFDRDHPAAVQPRQLAVPAPAVHRGAAAATPSYAFQLADSYNGRNADGTYADNSTEAFIAINCLDYARRQRPRRRCAPRRPSSSRSAPGARPAAGLRRHELRRAGRSRRRASAAPIAAAGSADILVVGTTNDPATPYMWAQRARRPAARTGTSSPTTARATPPTTSRTRA